MNIEILAHRANLAGPAPATENSLAATRAALEEGFGLETDLRREAGGRLYIAHDPQPWTEANDLAAYVELFRKHDAQVVAMNVKELGYEAELIAVQRAGDFGSRSFYFDFELLQPKAPGAAQRVMRSLGGGEAVRMASRLSDRGESLEQALAIPGEVVWADEFDALWLTEKEVRAVQAGGREFYVISPELHGFSEAERRGRWADFKKWGVDGICTDYALSAREYFSI